MNAVDKANAFIELAEKHGWTTSWTAEDNYSLIRVTATRKNERIIIGWYRNQLADPPDYLCGGISRTLHCAATARQRIMADGPDLREHAKRRRRKSKVGRALDVNGGMPSMPISGSKMAQPQNGYVDPSTIEEEDLFLPFDIYEDSDEKILREVLGSTIVWRNKMSGSYESEYIPKKKGNSRKSVFYLAESSDGRSYLSFMNANGVFRAVALESLVGVL